MNHKRLSAGDLAGNLIAEIQRGTIPVGDPLPAERQLCERFGASRTTVREALNELQIRGFANRETAHRPRAAIPTLGSIFQSARNELGWLLAEPEQRAHLEQLRQFIETGAVRVAAQHASDADVATMHAALMHCHDAISDDVDFGRADVEFHRAIVAATRNSILLDLHDQFTLDVIEARESRPDNQISFDEHRQIYEHIARREAEGAVVAMEHHLGRTFRASLEQPGRT